MKFYDDPPKKEEKAMKAEVDEQLEKLFEGMSRETARKVANQGSPKKRVEEKKTTVKKAVKKK